MPIPSRQEADEILTRLGVDPEDRAEMLDSGPPTAHPKLADLFARRHAELVEGMGGVGGLSDWPDLDEHRYGPLARYFYVWVFLTTIPELRAFHNSRGIPEADTWATMAELGGQMYYRRNIHGKGGLSSQNWMTAHFRGICYRIGRLVFERTHAWFTMHGVREGDPVLGVHIPRGRLTPQSCDEAFALASEFFPRLWPEIEYRASTCVSWVLDPQLADYLDDTTNILAFQRRFVLLPPDEERPADAETVEAIFAREWPGIQRLSQLPQRSTLERAVVTHLRSGGHWFYRGGVLR